MVVFGLSVVVEGEATQTLKKKVRQRAHVDVVKLAGNFTQRRRKIVVSLVRSKT